MPAGSFGLLQASNPVVFLVCLDFLQLECQDAIYRDEILAVLNSVEVLLPVSFLPRYQSLVVLTGIKKIISESLRMFFQVNVV